MADEEMKVVPISTPQQRRGRIIFEAPQSAFVGFVEFVRERGIVGLAIGFVLGSSVQKVVTALVDDLINPLIGVFAGRADGFQHFALGPFLIGDFISVLLNFFILAAVIYLVFKLLNLEKLDKPKA